MEDTSITQKTGPLPPTFFFILLILGIVLRLAVPAYTFLHWPYNLVGLAPLLFGSWITVWADNIFKRRGTTVKPHLDPSELIVSGPFRISRHPMYLGMALILLGEALLLGAVTPLAAPIAFAVIMQARFIPMEERSMERVFGKQYDAYRRRVRQWL
ncbi:MAG: isoprenylcysteine carboxylmethyltransferase family protein [Candidatus Zixiibacteriota bacterium]|jgi:protein-S-isoprenylcysteine O-methyltransferase Ste14